MTTLNASGFSKYIPTNERPVLSMLIKLALEYGNNVSVFDGEEYVLKRSTSFTAIQSELGGTGEDQLVILNSLGEQIGWFFLIYDNGSEGEPMVVISDLQANPFCEAIYNQLDSKY